MQLFPPHHGHMIFTWDLPMHQRQATLKGQLKHIWDTGSGTWAEGMQVLKRIVICTETLYFEVVSAVEAREKPEMFSPPGPATRLMGCGTRMTSSPCATVTHSQGSTHGPECSILAVRLPLLALASSATPAPAAMLASTILAHQGIETFK